MFVCELFSFFDFYDLFVSGTVFFKKTNLQTGGWDTPFYPKPRHSSACGQWAVTRKGVREFTPAVKQWWSLLRGSATIPLIIGGAAVVGGVLYSVEQTCAVLWM